MIGKIKEFFEKPENIIALSASGGGLLLIIIVLVLAVKLARDRKRPQQSDDNNVSDNNNEYDGLYQYVQGQEMTETQLNTSENGQPGEHQNLLAIYKSEW